jgi:hypothetical protein
MIPRRTRGQGAQGTDQEYRAGGPPDNFWVRGVPAEKPQGLQDTIRRHPVVLCYLPE